MNNYKVNDVSDNIIDSYSIVMFKYMFELQDQLRRENDAVKIKTINDKINQIERWLRNYNGFEDVITLNDILDIGKEVLQFDKNQRTISNKLDSKIVENETKKYKISAKDRIKNILSKKNDVINSCEEILINPQADVKKTK